MTANGRNRTLFQTQFSLMPVGVTKTNQPKNRSVYQIQLDFLSNGRYLSMKRTIMKIVS